MMIGRRLVNSASARTNVSGILSLSRHHIIVEQGIMQRHGSGLTSDDLRRASNDDRDI